MAQVKFIVLPLSTYKSGPPKMVAVGTVRGGMAKKNGPGLVEYKIQSL